eukprot:2929981-Rhodomonas_salina.1
MNGQTKERERGGAEKDTGRGREGGPQRGERQTGTPPHQNFLCGRSQRLQTRNQSHPLPGKAAQGRAGVPATGRAE